MGADSTLVNAAYRLGQSNVPGDYSGIFEKQFEGLIAANKARYEGIGDAIETVGENATRMAKENKEGRDKFDQVQQNYLKGLNDESVEASKAGASQNDAFVQNATSTIEGYKDEIQRLNKEHPNPGKKVREKLTTLYKDYEGFRKTLVEERSRHDVTMALFGNDEVDLEGSYGGDKNLQAVHAIAMNPNADHAAHGISLYRNSSKELMMEYKDNTMLLAYKYQKKMREMRDKGLDKLNLKSNPKGLQLTDGDTTSLDLKYSKFGMDKSMLEFIDSAEKRKVIRVKDLHGMVMKKDKTSNGLGNAIILDMQKVATDMIKTVDENGKKSEKYEHADFSRLQTQTFKKFEKIFLSPDANIRYLATQPQVIGYGDSERTYKDDKQKDLNLNKVIVDQMGLGSDILTLADVNTDGSIDKLDSDPAVLKEYGIELSKHNEAKAMIIEKLTNPQTESERKVAAKELANYWTRHAKAEFIYNRGPVEGDESTIIDTSETTDNPVVNYNDHKQFSYLNKSGNIGFLNKSNDGKTYVSGKAAKTKLDEIRAAKKGDIITHWQGSNTVRYVKTSIKMGDGTQTGGMFIQEKYNEEKGGFEAEQDKTRQDYGKQMTTQEVEKDMNFPNAMLQTIIEKNGKKYRKVEGGYIEIKK